VLAFANKNRGGCDALCHDPADIIDAVAVCARTTLTSARLSTLEASRQLDDFTIPVSECKGVGLLARELCA
jgi:hypothetical protein